MITPFETILETGRHEPEELKISGWKEDQEITVKVIKPNFYTMLSKNAIPNPLIPEMDKLFVKHDRSGHAKVDSEFAKVLIEIAKNVLVEPSYEQLQENGIELTDDQLTELSWYATEGAHALVTFREKIRAAAGKHDKTVQRAPEQDPEHHGSDDGVAAG